MFFLILWWFYKSREFRRRDDYFVMILGFGPLCVIAGPYLWYHAIRYGLTENPL